MQEAITHVGLDVHQEQISVAVLEAGCRRSTEFKLGGDHRGVRTLVRRLVELEAEARVECA